jgi:hypothetical protein
LPEPEEGVVLVGNEAGKEGGSPFLEDFEWQAKELGIH